MLDHTGIVVSDLMLSRRFYDAIAEALGLSTSSNSAESFLLGRSADAPSLISGLERSALHIGPMVLGQA